MEMTKHRYVQQLVEQVGEPPDEMRCQVCSRLKTDNIFI